MTDTQTIGVRMTEDNTIASLRFLSFFSSEVRIFEVLDFFIEFIIVLSLKIMYNIFLIIRCACMHVRTYAYKNSFFR